jgi:glycosyltransferase involved in cell wall biosynthesis
MKSRSAEERAAMGRRGRELVAKHFNRADLARQYLEILEGVVERHRLRR